MWKVQKRLHGFKQAPKQRCMKFDRIKNINALLKNFGDTCIILLLYIDDILLIAMACKYEIDKLEDKWSKEFVMKDLGAA